MAQFAPLRPGPRHGIAIADPVQRRKHDALALLSPKGHGLEVHPVKDTPQIEFDGVLSTAHPLQAVPLRWTTYIPFGRKRRGPIFHAPHVRPTLEDVFRLFPHGAGRHAHHVFRSPRRKFVQQAGVQRIIPVLHPGPFTVLVGHLNRHRIKETAYFLKMPPPGHMLHETFFSCQGMTGIAKAHVFPGEHPGRKKHGGARGSRLRSPRKKGHRRGRGAKIQSQQGSRLLPSPPPRQRAHLGHKGLG
ncbi:MAG: hypothetical protein BWY88_00226 [Synergistetes bacterium ADurb.Bin520]|nr:MAG: hypothetical protein BWY88_00226 [Synergistetes bacterium ADurb.Bin520]